MRRHFHHLAAFAILITLLASPHADAQPLADRIPADALVYIGWAGSEGAAGYDQSHLKAVLEAWQPLKALDEIMPALMAEAPEEQMRDWQRLRALAPLLYRHPSAFYFGGIEFDKVTGRPDSIRLAFVYEAGDDAERLTKLLRDGIDAHAGVRPENTQQKVTVKGGTVAVHFGPLPPDVAGRLGVGSAQDAQSAAAPLSEHDEFTAAMEPLGLNNAAAAVYVNLPRLLQSIERGQERSQPAEGLANFRKGRDILGLNGIKRITWAGGFDGRNWHTASWVEAPAPRRGVAALLAAPALEQQVIATVPRTATWLIAARFDLNKTWQLIREMVAFDQQAVQHLDQKLAEIDREIGVNVEEGVLAPLGDQWLMYGDPSMAMPFGPGGLVMNFTRDGEALQASLKNLMDATNKIIARDYQPGEQPPFRVQQMQSNDATIYAIGSPVFSPGVAVYEGRLYVAFSPQTVSMKIAMTQVQVTPITESPEWKQVMQKLGDRPSQAVVFVDLKQTAPVMLQGIANLAQMVQMRAPEGVNIMKVVPNITTLMPHLGPVGQVGWSDDSGIHSRSHSPFPFSETLSPVGGTMPATMGLLTGIMVPSLNRARDAARIAQSQNNLKQIGLAVHNWVDMQGGGQLPPDLSTLVKADLLEPQVLLNPRLPDAEPVPADLRPDQIDRRVQANSGYVYIGGGKNFLEMRQGTANTLIAYERLSRELGDKVNVLFADGHVETLPLEQAKQKLREAGVQLPDDGEAQGKPPAATAQAQNRQPQDARTVDQPPRELNNPQPSFPAAAASLGETGAVQVRLLIDEEGRVEDVRVINVVGNDAFKDAVLAVAPQWRFEPARHQDRPVRVWAQKTVRFESRK